jgi:hypothetical protein
MVKDMILQFGGEKFKFLHFVIFLIISSTMSDDKIHMLLNSLDCSKIVMYCLYHGLLFIF